MISTTVQSLKSLESSTLELELEVECMWCMVARCNSCCMYEQVCKDKYFCLNFFLKNGDYIV